MAPQFDQPSYTAVLGHYPTRNLTDNDRVSLAGLRKEISAANLQAANGWGRPILDAAVLNAILGEHVGLVASEGDLIPIGMLVSKVSQPGRSGGMVRRHIMWLIKQGVLACHPPS